MDHHAQTFSARVGSTLLVERPCYSIVEAPCVTGGDNGSLLVETSRLRHDFRLAPDVPRELDLPRLRPVVCFDEVPHTEGVRVSPD
jgi:hypothetical protein